MIEATGAAIPRRSRLPHLVGNKIFELQITILGDKIDIIPTHRGFVNFVTHFLYFGIYVYHFRRPACFTCRNNIHTDITAVYKLLQRFRVIIVYLALYFMRQ